MLTKKFKIFACWDLEKNREAGTTKIFFGKITHDFWDMPPIKKVRESIFEGIFRFWQKYFFQKNLATKGGNDGTRERQNEGTTLNEDWGNADTTLAQFKNWFFIHWSQCLGRTSNAFGHTFKYDARNLRSNILTGLWSSGCSLLNGRRTNGLAIVCNALWIVEGFKGPWPRHASWRCRRPPSPSSPS